MPDSPAPTGTRRDAAVAALADVARTPGVAKPDPILIADQVTRRFGGLTAVDVEHVEIQRGAITALIGPNGAGKTTFFNLLTGFDTPDTGSWLFNGKDLAGIPAYRVARMGMIRTFQLTKALSKEFAADNILVNTICIGKIKSGQHERRFTKDGISADDYYSKMSKDIPLKRVGEAQEVANVITFLASNAASYVTGTSINLDGGISGVL